MRRDNFSRDRHNPPRGRAAGAIWFAAGRCHALAARARLAVGVAALCAAMTLLAPLLTAEPVFTVLTGEGGAGTGKFLEDLSQVWRRLHRPSPARLAISRIPGAERRLRLLNRRRGHFAVIDTAAAVGRLSEYEDLAAIALLWPSYLHAVTMDPDLKELSLPLRQQVRVAPSARYAYQGLLKWSQHKPRQRKLLVLATAEPAFLSAGREPEPDAGLTPGEPEPDAGPDTTGVEDTAATEAPPPHLAAEAPAAPGRGWDAPAPRVVKADPANGGVVLFSAPAPLDEVLRELAQNPALRVLTVSRALVEKLRLIYPWLQTRRLARETYPGMAAGLVLPVRHLLLVGRRDLEEAVVAKMLNTLYGRKEALKPFNPLFGALDESQNAIFAKLIPFHPLTAKMLKFTLPRPGAAPAR